MNRTEARTIIEANPRRTLVVRFVKRTTGELRRMVCVHFPEGAEAARFRFNPAAKGLIAVWDVEKGARRFVNLDGVQEIKAGGKRIAPARLDFTERRAPDRQPAKGNPSERHGGSDPEPKEDAPAALEKTPAKRERPGETPWENAEQAEQELAQLFDTFTI